MKTLATLSKKIGYTFKNEALLHLALSHRSVGKINNERLEFLGDSILNFIVGEKLFQQHPEAAEGDLSRMRAALVKGETLTLLAKELSLGDYLILGQGELKSGGFKRSSILAGALEAVIGAMYLDGGFDACYGCINAWFLLRVQALNSAQECKDAKTLLQEYLQAKHFEIPKYHLLETKGQAHNQTFIIECEVIELGIKLTAKGSSRRKAEQAAAEKVLKAIQHDD